MDEEDEIKGIIFDIGGVLVGDSGPACIKNASEKLKVSFDRLKRIMPEEVPALQRGEESSIHFWHRMCKTLNAQCPPDKVLSSLWENPYKRSVKIKEDTLDLVKRLKDRYKLAILSNTISEHVAVNRKRRLFEYFDVVLLSNEAGTRKPERTFFELVADRLNIPFNNLVFVDNEMQWVRAAQKHGLRAILFKSARQVEESFKGLGINVG